MSTGSNQVASHSTQSELVHTLSQVDCEQMLDLMQTYYDGVHPEDFRRDLSEKTWILTVRDSDGAIQGFSTQVLLQVPGCEKTLALFSGDTIVDKRFRGENNLAGQWGKLALSLMDQFPNQTLYWFLISKGYKTYRYLPLFFHEYFPNLTGAFPSEMRGVQDELAKRKFGDRYDPQRGIVVAQDRGCRLRSDVAPLLPHRMSDPYIALFSRLNPGHASGDELCCLAPLHRQNFTPMAYRAIERCDLQAIR
jgi:hypothetical protein